MKQFLFSVILTGFYWVGFFAVDVQAQGFTGNLDELIDWNNPWSLTLDKYKQVVDPMAKNQTDPVYSVRDNQGDFPSYRLELSQSGLVHGKKPALFDGKVTTIGLMVTFQRDQAFSFRFNIGERGIPSAKELAVFRAEVARHSGDDAPRALESSLNSGIQDLVWSHQNYNVKLITSVAGVVLIEITKRPVEYDKLLKDSMPLKLEADIDAMLNLNSLWQWTASDFEKNYVPKIEDQSKQQKPPQFEWLSASKDRARFSRHMFSNVETKLTMFGGSIKVEEAILEFVNGKAARATISFYNRGDSGDIEVKEFDRIFKAIGQNLSQVMKVAPKKQTVSSNAALPVTGWNWSTPSGIALLEYNEYNTPGKVTKPEFLRLKLAAPNQVDWSMGKMATGVQRMELVQRVKKTPEGDVYISGVPMVDQGQKGYCVAASCQRLFEYMRIPCDQHEMAKLVNVDAEGGADISTMQKSLAKIDGAFKVTFKPLVNPEVYYDRNHKRRVSEKEFFSLVKDYTDKGVPLLWGLMLGEKPEIPPLPNAGQTRGGHMRMVIGYNLAKNQVIFTDSWGAGHELKRMALLDAYDVTMGLYSMAPRGF